MNYACEFLFCKGLQLNFILGKNTVYPFGGDLWGIVLFCGYKRRILQFSSKMLNLLGEYEISVDSKGRFSLPASFRKQLPEGSGERFVINRGFENCLTLYPVDSWNKISAEVDALSDFKPKNREFKRLFRNGATFVDVDSADRILVPKKLLEYANINKEMVFTAQGNKVELWDKDTYYSYIDDHKDNFSDLAEEVTGGNDQPKES